jgi:hypothetical protein
MKGNASGRMVAFGYKTVLTDIASCVLCVGVISKSLTVRTDLTSTGPTGRNVHGSVHHNTNLIETTNKMQLCRTIYYSIVP